MPAMMYAYWTYASASERGCYRGRVYEDHIAMLVAVMRPSDCIWMVPGTEDGDG